MKKIFPWFLVLILIVFAVTALNCGNDRHPATQAVGQFAFAQYTGGASTPMATRAEMRHYRFTHPQQFLGPHSRPGNGVLPVVANGVTYYDDVYLMNIDGTGLLQVATGLSIQGVHESADGRSGVASADDDAGYAQIYYVNLADQRNPTITQLTTSQEHHICPQISWDGTQIVYMKYVDEISLWQVFTISTSGGTETQVPTESNAVTPSFTPGGKILFDQEPDDGIWIMNADGTGATQLTTVDANTWDEFPTASPDGNTIVYSRWVESEGSTSDIWSANIDGTNPTQLTTDGQNVDPMFVRNKIIFVSWRDGNSTEIYSMNPDGTSPTRLTNNSLFDYLDDWFD